LTDVDAITLSLARSAEAQAAVAAITIAVVSNTVVKMGLVWSVGKRALARVSCPQLCCSLWAQLLHFFSTRLLEAAARREAAAQSSLEPGGECHSAPFLRHSQLFAATTHSDN
jgi:hypothetical protein